jgi:SAM-dependent methyltransferase
MIRRLLGRTPDEQEIVLQGETESLSHYDNVLARMAARPGANPDEDADLLRELLREGLLYLPGKAKEQYRSYLVVHELYKKVLTVPGHIVELGVYRGKTTLLFAYLIQLYSEAHRHRHIYAFDTFEGYVPADLAPDDAAAADYQNTSLEFVDNLVKQADARGFVHLIKGDISKTLPEFLESHADFKVALLYNDTNLYNPSKVALESLLPRMQPGGVVYLDSYNNPKQRGETRAADEVLGEFDLTLQRDIPPLSQPAYCIIPPGGARRVGSGG